MLNSARFSHWLSGLSVQSNLPIPGLSCLKANIQDENSDPGAVEVHFGASPSLFAESWDENNDPCYVSPYLAPSGEPALRVWRIDRRGLLYLSYIDGTKFWLDQVGRNIWSLWPDELSLENTAMYLLGPVLGLLLRLRGSTCLHASAVVIGGKAAVFLGPSGAGKSTAAAIVARDGCTVLADDIVALTESEIGFEVLPSCPFLSLWPEPVNSIYGSTDAAPRHLPAWEKRRVDEGNLGLKFERKPAPLGAIYILAPREESASIKAVSAETAFLSLVSNTYATNLLTTELRAREFRVLNRLIERVPIRQLAAANDLRQFDELRRLICRDFAGRNSHTVPAPCS
jgi:hypothetical protein